ncbi:MAG: cation diffusion facilitator family transporter [Phycisphaerae bacterium]
MPASERTSRTALTGRSVTWAGIAVNSLLGAAKILAGLVFRSQAILADGFHSASDLITDVAVLAGLGASEKPADGRHPYGHRRISTLVAMFVGAALAIVAASIAYNAVVSFRQPHEPMTSLLPLVLAVATIPLKELLFHLTRYVGRRTADISLLANAWHHRSDAFTSVAAAAGLTVVAVGGAGWAFVDELTALVLSAFLVVAAIGIIRTSAAELIDRAPSPATLAAIERAVANTDGVHDYHAVRARQVGGKIAMDIHVLVDPQLTVREGHDIAAAVEESVQRADANIVEAVVHIEPHEHDGPDEPAHRPAGSESGRDEQGTELP